MDLDFISILLKPRVQELLWNSIESCL